MTTRPLSPRLAWVLVGLLACTAATGQGRDTVYKVIGPDGKVTYSQDPPAGGGTVAKKMEFEQLPASPLPSYVLKFREEMERNIVAKQAGEAPPTGLRLFSAKWCGYCKLAKAWLARHGTAYEELDIGTPGGMRAFIQSGARSNVPLLVGPNNLRLQGFTEAAYASALAPKKR